VVVRRPQAREKGADMMIIGVDYHPSFQQIGFFVEETGACGEQRLNHDDGEAEKFFSAGVETIFSTGTVGEPRALRAKPSLRECPVCHRGCMIAVEALPQVRSSPTIQDTS